MWKKSYWTSIVVLSLALTACTKKNKSEYGLNPSDMLSVSLDTEPPTLDWNKASDTTSSNVLYNIMSGLVQYDLNDPELSLKPDLATEWSSDKSAKVWTFKIRKGVKWTDGVDLTAQQFLDGWVRLLNPKTASVYAYFLFGIKNAKDFNSGKIKDAAKIGITAVDDLTLKVELAEPMSFFPKLLSHSSTYPTRLDTIKKFGDNWTEPENIVTLGPYYLKTWDHDKAIVLERSDSYYGTPAKIKNILGYIINEKSTVLNLFETGKLDHVKDLPAIELPSLRTKPEFTSKGILGIYYLGYNTKRAPLDNVNVRKAITMAIDKQQIVKMLDAGHKPLEGWLPEGMFGHVNGIGIKFDVKKANELLDKAGYSNRSKFPTIFYGFNTNENHQRVAENVQSQLRKNLGINVEIKNEEWKVYLSTLKTNPPHIFRLGWVADFPDPDNFMAMLMGDSAQNHTGWKNNKFDSLITKAAMTLDKAKRKEMYLEAQKILTEADVPVFPVYSMSTSHLISKRVINFPINSLFEFRYKDVELKK